MAIPLTKVPLRLSRSRIEYRSPVRRMMQCRRDREGSLIDSRLAGSRPTGTSAFDRAKLESFNGPAIACNLGFTYAPRAWSPHLFSTLRDSVHKICGHCPISEQIALYP